MKIALRIAAVLMLLHTLGHTMGALTWKNAPNARVAAVVTGMENEHFDFMGRSLTLASFFNGYGFIMIGVLLLISILLWLLSSTPVRGIILLLGLFLVFMAIVEFIYFFPFAAAFSLLAGISTLFAYQKSKAL
ncbi:hypothetical protein [Mucilaginibacter sp.]|uniref:LIC_13387 family protein n=1 Tax=Mucilaginibacter sp. TaxID=1882438 RepID=UPI002623D6E5|nr:hypothetical protein [Mucilaginibacter sp.]MDB5127768.1 hypothetical protein [Mucilaginibacter sp.]